MGQAKRRGTLEERAADPKGNSWCPAYWTEELSQRFKEKMTAELGVYIDKVRGDLFTKRKPKKKSRKVRTGG
jgi:hypothetical protein